MSEHYPDIEIQLENIADELKLIREILEKIIK